MAHHYEMLPHTADVRLKVTGATLPELFAAALEGMSEIIKAGACRGKTALTERAVLTVDSPDVTALLVDFLSAVLTRSHERGVVFCTVTFTQLTETKLVASLGGRRAAKFDEDIKAVTYHDAEVRRNASGEWETTLVFDI